MLEIEKYGIKKDFFEFDFVRDDQERGAGVQSLDFEVENKTGKTVIIACFTFEKKAKGKAKSKSNKVSL